MYYWYGFEALWEWCTNTTAAAAAAVHDDDDDDGGCGGGGGGNDIDTSVVFPSTATKVTKNVGITVLPSKQVYLVYLTYLQLAVWGDLIKSRWWKQ